MRRISRCQVHLQLLVVLVLFGVVVAVSSCIALFGYKYKQISLMDTLKVSSGITTPHPMQHYRNHNYSSIQQPPLAATVLKKQPPPPLAATVLEPPPPTTTKTISVDSESENGPYHNWDLFETDFQEMMTHLKIFAYPDIFNNSKENPSAHIFLPHPNPFQNPKLGNYFSEHIFKVSLLHSSFLTSVPEKAHFFFLPFSINNLRYDRHIDASIAEYVAQYTTRISHQFRFWNASGGADHFYAYCHSVGREAASKHPGLHNSAIQLTCSSSYFQRLYVSHKDVGLPQVWPRPHQTSLNPPHARHRLVFFAGRAQNSQVRQDLINLWANDTEMDIYKDRLSFPYEEGFKRSKYCLHVKGYEVNTARVSDAIHYGCIPVIISNYYDLPFANVLDWGKFSIIISHQDIAFLKRILLAITKQEYLRMYHNLCKVRRHFVWHTTPRGYDSFYMTAYQLWLRRSIHRLSY